jgi:hypothetical protein
MADETKHLTPDAVALGYDADEPNPKLVTIVMIAVVITIVVSVLAVQWFWENKRYSELQQKVEAPVAEDYTVLRQQEEQQLNNYKRIQNSPNVQLPIQRAMALMAEGYKQGKPGYPVQNQPVAKYMDNPQGTDGGPAGSNPAGPAAAGQSGAPVNAGQPATAAGAAGTGH